MKDMKIKELPVEMTKDLFFDPDRIFR